MRVKIGDCLLIVLFAARFASAAAGGQYNLEAVRLNNRGVALMSQQAPEQAEKSFAEAFKIDPKLAQAAINDGIALYTLQKLAPAQQVLQKALALDSNSAQAWFNLGLIQRAGNELPLAVASFQRAAEIDPRDADSLYFEAACYAEMGQFVQAIPVFRNALAINPFHASSEFGVARSLLRTGNTAEAREHLNRFQHLTSTKIGAPISLAYGEQGHYSTVTAVQEPETIESKMIAVRLVATPMVGTNVKPEWTTTGGACMIDATGSGQMDLVLMQSGSQSIRILHRNDGNFEELDAPSMGLKASGRAVACAVGDYDGDGMNDLAVALDDAVLLFRNLGHGKFQDVTTQSNLAPHNRPTGITFIDYDHDGDLDLFLTGSPLKAGGESNLLWRNNGNRTFTEQTQETALGGSGKTAAAVLTDFNNDRAVDIAVSGDGAAPVLEINPREGKYPTQSLYDGENLPPSEGSAVFDFNKDGWMDIAVTHDRQPGLTLWRNVTGQDRVSRRFERVPLPLQDALRGWGLTPIDIDNDGWIDLAAIVETSAGPQVRVFRNKGEAGFEDVSHALGLDEVKLSAPRGLIAADLEDKGAPDLIVIQSDAPPVLLRNVGANKNHFVRIDLLGVADNKAGLGVKVEVFANGLWQKLELPGASGLATQGPPQLLIGLGQAEGIDVLRILWPTGVLQDELDLPHSETVHIKEVDRRGSSCPVLFVWNGHKYEFVTDVIGAGVVGHWFTPTRRNIPRPSEWVKIDGADVVPVNGKISVRFMEPMEEVNYVDQLRLFAVDHPEGVEVNPDERFLDNPPFASGRVVASVDARPPLGAWDGEGRDVLDTLRRRDHQFTSDFTALPYDGFANLHALTLDLGKIDPKSPLRLLMTGYVNYFSATSLYAASQAGVRPIAPYVEAQLANGAWQPVTGEAGFPAGLERTIVIDLTGKLPAGTRRIRLMTNLQIYWDQVLIDTIPQGKFRTTELPLDFATEQFRGYPKEMDGASPGDLRYDYDLVSLTGPFQRERGNYTHFGNITALIKSVDDRFAIFGGGEGIAAEFDTSKLPALPQHWKRDYFFYANGYEKDMDMWDSSPFTVAPLPFHAMTSYPSSDIEGLPTSNAALAYRLNWNDRVESGAPAGLHRFNFQEIPSTPRDDHADGIRK